MQIQNLKKREISSNIAVVFSKCTSVCYIYMKIHAHMSEKEILKAYFHLP